MGKGAKKRKSLVNMNIQVATAQQAIFHLVQPGDLPKARLETHGILLLEVSENTLLVTLRHDIVPHAKISCRKSRLVTNCYQKSSSSGCCLKAQFALKAATKYFCDPISDERTTSRPAGEKVPLGKVRTASSDTSLGHFSASSKIINRILEREVLKLLTILDGFLSRNLSFFKIQNSLEL